MPRPKPDKIIRHQIVFGEADRKILEGFKDSYLLSNLSANFVKLINDVTGTATFLALIAATGVLGVSFVFSASAVALASGGSSVFDEFYDALSVARGTQAEQQAAKNEARVKSKVAAEAVGDILDPFPGNPIAGIIARIIPDFAIYGRPE